MSKKIINLTKKLILSLQIQDKQKIVSDKQLYGALKTEARYSLRKYLNELKKVGPITQKLIDNIKVDIKRLKEK